MLWSRGGRSSVLVAAVLASLGAMALPSAAEAGTVTVVGSRLFYLDIPGLNASGTAEENSLSITFESGQYVFTDAGAVVTTGTTPSGRCGYTTSSHTVKCLAVPGDRLLVDTGALDDQVQTSIPINTGLYGGFGDDTLTATGNQPVTLVGCSGDDVLVGSEGFSSLVGDDECSTDPIDTYEPGNDVMVGKQGDDVFFGGEGDDFVQGGAGSDTMLGDENASRELGAQGNDVFVGGEGDDLIVGGGGQDQLFGGGGADQLAGGEGNDREFGDDGTDTLGVTVALSEVVISRDAGDDLMLGGTGDDVLDGGPGEFVLNRGARFNPIEAVDETSPNGQDTLLGGDGTDTVTYDHRQLPVSVMIDNTANDGSAGEQDEVGGDVEVVKGGVRDDVLRAGSAGMTLDGGRGDDLVVGGRGNDTLLGGTDDTGKDTLIGASGNDKLAGEGAEDTLRGNAGIDHIDGGSGGDYIDGGDGADDLQGHSGADIIRARSAGADTVRCGAGLDFVIIGRRTRAKGDCERSDKRAKQIAVRPLAGASAFGPPLMFNSAPLIDALNIPFDTEIALGKRGRIAVRKSLPAVGGSSRATLTGGSFVILRGRGRIAFELRLLRSGGNVDCADPAKRAATTIRVNGRRPVGVIGRRSESIGRKAAWRAEERCGGTLTRVHKGKVLVSDFRRDRQVVVKAGQAYLAR
jgi:Ca2+-binding RTX toxin-like protein